ncbi:MAG: hypothetical protein SOY43_03910 [Parabacteroides sp.]|nr:hypothetical protein [bacterium]MDY4102025.1 hypothetical protein [Parabacteroides sp.]
MSDNKARVYINELFKSKRKCLLLNYSFKHRCDDRMDYPILFGLLPVLKKNRVFLGSLPNNTLVSFICTSHLSVDIRVLGFIDSPLEGVEHYCILVKSHIVESYVFSLLRTTPLVLSPDQVDLLMGVSYDYTILLDFYNWHTESFKRFYDNLESTFSVAVMDGFNQISFTEKDSMEQEVKQVVESYTLQDRVCCRRIQKQFSYGDFVSLCCAPNRTRETQIKEIRKKIQSIALYFDTSSINLWKTVFDHFGKNNIIGIEDRTADNILRSCIEFSLRELLNEKGQYELFEGIFPKWRNYFDNWLSKYKHQPMPTKAFERFCEEIVTLNFANYVFSNLKIYSKNNK